MGIVYSNKRYVTYKEPDKLKEFRPSCILTHLESSFLGTKPISGWWGSPVDANFGWKDWCESIVVLDPSKIIFERSNNE